jgi:outer membrane protein OmpA-like peptidoglycan-associated protein
MVQLATSFKDKLMRKSFPLSTLALALAVSGCATTNMNPVQRGTATGAGIGAGVGAVLGAATGDGGGRRAATGAAIGTAAGAVIGNIWSSRMEQQKRTMEQATAGTGVQVTQTADNRLKLDIPTDISFDTNRYDIKPNFRPILDRFAATLVENPYARVNIIGHTDATGGDAINNPLSINRAAQTRDYLIQHGVASNRIGIDGRGSREPVAGNETETSRARNRRVEIFVAEQQATAQAPQQSSGAPAPGTVYSSGSPAPGTVYPSGSPAPGQVYSSGGPAPGQVYSSGSPAPGTAYPSGNPAPGTAYPAGYPSGGPPQGTAYPSGYPSGSPAPGSAYPSPYPSGGPVYPSGGPARAPVYSNPPAGGAGGLLPPR